LNKCSKQLFEHKEGTVSYRLTNPARLVRGMIIIGLSLSFALAGFSGSLATDSSQNPDASFEYVTVFSGDTLWALAQRHGSGDPRDWIHEVVRLNGLQSSELAPGQQLALPLR
jgi:LysM repeat protein